MSEFPPIDIVILWVDGSDPAWQARRAAYEASGPDEHIGPQRFFDAGTLRFALRSIERHMPWYGTLHLVTDGQLPSWLNTAHPRLRLVTHAEIFEDAAHLPSFNSNAIQMHLARIPGLSEYFILFDDDMLLTRPLSPKHFFAGGLPIRPAYFGCLMDDAPFQRNCRMNLERVREAAGGIFTSAFWRAIRRCLSPRVWAFNALVFAYAKGRGLTLFPGGYDHIPYAFRKQDLAAAEALLPQTIRATRAHRFRQEDDASPWFLRMLSFARGQFSPGLWRNRIIVLRDDITEITQLAAYRRTPYESPLVYAITRLLCAGRYIALCLQDQTTSAMPPAARAQQRAAVESYLSGLLPQKSEFETGPKSDEKGTDELSD